MTPILILPASSVKLSNQLIKRVANLKCWAKYKIGVGLVMSSELSAWAHNDVPKLLNEGLQCYSVDDEKGQNRRCRVSTPGDRREYSPLYYNDINVTCNFGIIFLLIPWAPRKANARMHRHQEWDYKFREFKLHGTIKMKLNTKMKLMLIHYDQFANEHFWW